MSGVLFGQLYGHSTYPTAYLTHHCCLKRSVADYAPQHSAGWRCLNRRVSSDWRQKSATNIKPSSHNRPTTRCHFLSVISLCCLQLPSTLLSTFQPTSHSLSSASLFFPRNSSFWSLRYNALWVCRFCQSVDSPNDWYHLLIEAFLASFQVVWRTGIGHGPMIGLYVFNLILRKLWTGNQKTKRKLNAIYIRASLKIRYRVGIVRQVDSVWRTMKLLWYIAYLGLSLW
jgi:hypothetical protein